MGRTCLVRIATVGVLAGASLIAGSGPAGADVLVVDAATLVVSNFSVAIGIVELSPQTPVGGITGRLVAVVPDADPGCDAGDFAGFPAGAIALVNDGGCSIEQKHDNAAAAGAIGVVIDKNAPGPLEGALENPGTVPTGIISQNDGFFLRSMPSLTATLELRYHFEPEYAFSGFMGSVDDAPTVNTGKAGRTYALTWQLTRAGEPVTDLGAITSVTSKSTGCGVFTDDPADALEATASGSAGLRYDDQAGTFVYNWKTPKGRACYTLFITLDDGQVFPAYFDLR